MIPKLIIYLVNILYELRLIMWCQGNRYQVSIPCTFPANNLLNLYQSFLYVPLLHYNCLFINSPCKSINAMSVPNDYLCPRSSRSTQQLNHRNVGRCILRLTVLLCGVGIDTIPEQRFLLSTLLTRHFPTLFINNNLKKVCQGPS